MDIKNTAKVKILTLSENTNLKQREIAAKCRVSQSAVSKVLNRFRQSGSLETNRKGNCGRKRSSTVLDDRSLLRKSRKIAHLNSVNLRREMSARGVDISARTIRRRLSEHSRPARRPVRKPFLSKAMKKKRFEWAKAHQNWTLDDWKKVSKNN